MADEADLSDGYAERIVEESLRLLRNSQVAAATECSYCEEHPVEVLPNGLSSRLCTRCRLEKEEELLMVILPVTVVPMQGDTPEDSWTATQIGTNRYRRKWWRFCNG